MGKVKIQINGQDVEVDEGLNLIEAARQVGEEIPHFCYHPGLGVDGNCRMCLVEIEGIPKPQIACGTPVKEGMSVQTKSDRVKDLQKSVLEFLFLNHPLDCPICDQSGECYLQDYYMSNGQYDSRLDTPKVHKRKVHPVGPRVTLDAERCVLCTRCVRFCDQVTGTGELRIVNRGNRAEITTWPEKPLDNPYSLNTVDVCPVGALTSNDFRFQKRVWHLHTTKSICTGCSRGCNIFLEEHEGRVYRYRPRENMQVNRYWMCDDGRMTYKRLNEARLQVAMKGDTDLGFSVASSEAKEWVQRAKAAGEGTSMILVSPQSSTETLFAAKRFAVEVLPKARIAGENVRPPFVEDQLLRKADANPNTTGMELLGLRQDPAAELAKGGELLIVIEDDPLATKPEWRAHFETFQHVLYLGTQECASSRTAHLALPVAPHSECEGTFVNFMGRVQRFKKAMTPEGDALWGPALLQLLAGEDGFGWKSAPELWKELAVSESEFEGVDYAALGDRGTTVRSRASEPAAVNG